MTAVTDIVHKIDGKGYTRRELHQLYSPNLWTRDGRAGESDLISRHYKISVDGTEEVRTKLKCTLDYSYGKLHSNAFDIYGTDLSPSAPVFFFVHGGAWQFGSKNMSGFFAPTFYNWGFKTIVFGYSLAPEASVTDMVTELKSGLKAAFMLFPKAKFVVAGHSAGAHLVSCILHDQELNCSQIKRVVLLSGIYDLRMLVRTVFNTQIKITTEEVQRLSSSLQSEVNPAFKKTGTRILIIVGDHESPEFKRQARECNSHLQELGFQTSIWVSEQDDHFTVIEELVDAKSAVAKQIHGFISDLGTTKGWVRLCQL